MRILLILLFVLFPYFLFGQEKFHRNEDIFKSFFQPGSLGNMASIPNSSEFNVQDNFTIEIMLRFISPTSTSNGAIFINTVGPSGENDWGFGFVSFLGNKFGFHVCTSQPAQIQANQLDTVSACRWYHLAGVKEGQEIKFYLDGELKATTPFPGQIRTATGSAQFGYHRPPYTNWFNGNLDEFRFWRTARSQAQIQSTMNDTLLGNEPDLRAYYKFNQTGLGGNLEVENSAPVTGAILNGLTVSNNSQYPKFLETEILPFPPPPLIPTQPVLCHPGGQFDLNVTSPTGQNINRFHWYESDHPDTSRIPNTIRSTYKTPILNQTDTFFVSAVNSLFCESRKVGVVARVLPPLTNVSLSASKTTFCNSATIQFTATNLPIVKYAWWRGYNGNIPFFNPDSSSTIIIPNLDHSDTIWVQYSTLEGNCLSEKVFFIVTKVPKSPEPVLSSSNLRVCKGSKATFSVAGTGTRMVKLYSDSALTQFIVQAGFNQPIQTPDILSDRVFWVALSADTNGCESYGSKLIVVMNPLPIVEAGFSPPVCSGKSFQLGQDGNPEYHYQWTSKGRVPAPTLPVSFNSDTISNPQITFESSFFQIAPQDLILTATDRTTGCKNSDSVLVLVGLIPPLLGHSDSTICGSGLVKMNRYLEPNIALAYDTFFLYQWSTTLGSFQNPTSRITILNLTNSGQTQVISQSILHTTDSRTGCNSRDTVTLISNPLPLIEAGSDTALCSGFGTHIGFTGTPASISYQWFPTMGLSNDTIPNPLVSLDNTGATFSTNYIFTATSKLTGCKKNDTILITSNSLPTTNAGPDRVLCSNETTTIGTTGNIEQIRYSWSPPTFLQIDTLPIVSLNALNNTQQSSSYQYFVSTENRLTKCRNKDSVMVTINPLPLLSAGNDTTVCSGAPVSLGVIGNLQTTHYQWVNTIGISNDTISNPIFQFVNPALTTIEQKILTATFRNTGCHKSDTISITVYTLPKPNAGQDKVFCFDGSGNLGTNQLAGYQYNWSPSDSLASPSNGQTPIHYFNSDTLSQNLNYVLEMKNDTTGCLATDSVLVRVKGYVRADAGIDKAFCSDVEITIGTVGFQGHTYSWSPTNGLINSNNDTTHISLQNLVATNHADTIVYKRTVAFDGCENKDSIQVVVFPRPRNLEITGSKNVCPGTLATEYEVVANPLNHFLSWYQSGGGFAGWNAGDSVQINWGDTNPNAWVRFVPTNMFGCSGDSVFYAVKVNKLLFPEIDIVSDRSLIHNDSVCINQANPVRYKTRFTTPGSSYQWNILPTSAGVIVSNPKEREISIKWNAPGTYQIFVSQFDTTNIDTCFGTSENYIVHILPSPDTTLEMVGDTIVCAFTTNKLYNLAGSNNSKYDWQITRSVQNQTLPQSPGILVVNFGDAGLDTLRVLETNTIGCPSKWQTKAISVKPLPNTTLSVANDYNICPNNLLERGYKVFGLSGSGFEWMTENSGIITNGAGSDSVVINWNTSNPILNVLETSAFGCRKDTLKFSFNYDASQPVIHSVSTQEVDDGKIEVRFELQKPENHPTKTFELWKNGSLLSTLNSTQNMLIDTDVSTSSDVYQYQLKSINSCKIVMETQMFNNILLKVSPGLEEENSFLKWNKYNSWTSIGRCDYDIIRKTDGNPLPGSFGNLRYVNTQQPDNLEFTSSSTDNGFKQCYRIFYYEGDASVRRSYSNWACVDFEHLMSFPNLITPNGDGKNDVFEVRNLELYPPAEIQIFDRWGKKVFSSDHYLNDWADNDGMYFYTFKSEGVIKNGWITVVR